MRNRQLGFTVIELVIAVAISTVLALSTAAALKWQSETRLADGGAEYLVAASAGLSQYGLTYFNEHANNIDIPGVANDTAPTLAELKALGFISSALPTTMATRQSVVFSITKQSCPGTSCQLIMLACTSSPITLGGTSTRFDLASEMTTAQGGTGGQSLIGSGATIKGPTITAANPLGNVEGIVCGTNQLNTQLYQNFVRIADTRDPNLQGPLTVGGATTLKGATNVQNTLNVTGAATMSSTLGVTGAITGNNSIGATPSGNCLRASLETSGQVVVRQAAGCLTRGVLDATGTLTLNDASGNARLVADSTGAITGRTAAGATQVDMNVVGNQVRAWNSAGSAQTVVMDGSAGRLTAQTARLTTTATAGSSCAAFLEGDVALDTTSTSGLVTCRSNVWRGARVGTSPASDGGACSPDGSLGQDNSGVVFICRGAVWYSLSGHLSRSVVMQRYLVFNGDTVPKPTCGTGGVPAIKLTPIDTADDWTVNPSRSKYAALATSGAGSWTVSLKLYNSNGTGFTSSPSGTAYNLRAFAESLCDYPN